MEQHKRAALALTVLMTAAFAAPGVQHVLPAGFHARDGFPISTFPMFSKKRPDEHRMTWVRGLDANKKDLGSIHYRGYNSGGMNQAMAHIRKARTKDKAKRRVICDRIATRIGPRASYIDVEWVEIVDAYYIPAKVFGPERRDVPERLDVLVRCPVPGPRPDPVQP